MRPWAQRQGASGVCALHGLLSQEQFNQLLAAQGYACAMGGESFEEGQRIFADHDHNCCPPPVKPNGQTKTCGKCIRGLLCFRCNTALRHVEKYGARADAYLAQAVAKRAV